MKDGGFRRIRVVGMRGNRRQQRSALTQQNTRPTCCICLLSRQLRTKKSRSMQTVTRLRSLHYTLLHLRLCLPRRRPCTSRRSHLPVANRLFLTYKLYSNSCRPLDRLFVFFDRVTLTFDLILIGGRGIVLDNPYAKFGDFSSSRQTHRHTNTQTLLNAFLTRLSKNKIDVMCCLLYTSPSPRD